MTSLAVQSSASGAQILPGRLPSAGAPWTGSTNEPGSFGAPTHGHDAKVIGNFTSYPHDTYRSGKVRFGVVAFHVNGIDRVLFGINQPGNGPNDLAAWTPVTEMTINPDTGQAEYWVEFDVSALPTNGTADGKYSLRAIGVPKTSGKPRLLDFDHRFMSGGREYEWTFWCNPGSTLPAAATVIGSGQSISAAAQAVGEGGTVYLQEGNYRSEQINVSTPNGRYVTIRPAPGANPENVVINSASSGSKRGAAAFIKWVDVTVRPPSSFNAYGFLQNRNTDQACLVLESIHYVGSGTSEIRSRLVNPGPSGSNLSNDGFLNKGFYVVGRPDRKVVIENTFEPFSRWTLLRGMHVDGWGEDLFRDVKGAMDVRAVDWARENQHADFWQVYYPELAGEQIDNCLFYNIDVVATWGGAQPIYGAFAGSTWNNIAFVNFSFWRPDGVNGGIGGWWLTCNHLLLLNSTIYGVYQKIGGTGSSWHQPRIRNGLIKGCVFEGLNYMASSGAQDPTAIASQDVEFSDNHFIDSGGFLYSGASDPRTTRGGSPASLFVDPDNYTAVGGQATFADPDMRPRPGSILGAGAVANRMARIVPTDLHGVPRTAVTSVGAFASNSDPSADSDNDGVPDLNDGCPFEAQLTSPGVCGCDPSPDDSDSDGVPDCVDLCPGFDDNDDQDGNGVPDGCDTPANACSTGFSQWQSHPIPATSGTLSVEFDAVANGSGTDGVTTLSLGAPSSYNDCAMLVRFSSAGYIDARDGNVYRSETTAAYTPGQAYHFRVDADVAAKRYAVRVRPFGSGAYVTIASNHAFRTQQADVPWIDHWGMVSGQGTHTVCNFDATPDGSACVGDIDGDGSVGFNDLMSMLSDWGECQACGGDVNGDGSVGFYDLLAIVNAFGDC